LGALSTLLLFVVSWGLNENECSLVGPYCGTAGVFSTDPLMFLLIRMYWVGIKDGRVGVELVPYRLTRRTTFVYNGTSASLKGCGLLADG
jgi:hypothetical protein